MELFFFPDIRPPLPPPSSRKYRPINFARMYAKDVLTGFDGII